jgi:hypothetical protein
MRVVVTITQTGHVIQDLGPEPSLELLDLARTIATSTDGAFVAETECLSPEARTAVAQRLTELFLGGFR